MDSLSWCESRGRVQFFPGLPSSTVVFVCELTICMEIDQSARLTRRVMNFQIAVFVAVWIGGSMSSSLSTSPITVFYLLRDCTDLVTLSP